MRANDEAPFQNTIQTAFQNPWKESKFVNARADLNKGNWSAKP